MRKFLSAVLKQRKENGNPSKVWWSSREPQFCCGQGRWELAPSMLCRMKPTHLEGKRWLPLCSPKLRWGLMLLSYVWALCSFTLMKASHTFDTVKAELKQIHSEFHIWQKEQWWTGASSVMAGLFFSSEDNNQTQMLKSDMVLLAHVNNSCSCC